MLSPYSLLRDALLAGVFIVCTSAWADVYEDVPDAAEYDVVYTLNIPEGGAFAGNEVPYQDDTRAEWDSNFDRVAYYLKLQRPDEAPRFVFVSGEAFTESGVDLGIPVSGSGIFHHRSFDDMTVVTNVPGLTAGTNMAGGFLEMWEWNYGPANSARVPGASSDAYDFGDMPLPGEGQYGSFQVHNFEEGQTLFAYNRWNDDQPSDLGIGSNIEPLPNGVIQRDWTFRGNAGEYSVRLLQVLVRPGEPPAPPPPPSMVLQSPQSCQVFQRQRGDQGQVTIRGRLGVSGDRVEARLVPTQGGEMTDWRLVDDSVQAGFFSGEVLARSGFYRLELRVSLEDEVVGLHQVDSVGVGEVFIIAGQSNSANSGIPQLAPADPRVCNTDGTNWGPAVDPQPIATGTGGSPWPPFGDYFAERYNVPVGIMSVGWGGTQVAQWVPGHPSNLFARLQLAADTFDEGGVRAVLWHQGESDSVANTSAVDYFIRLSSVIDGMRVHAGWAIPWGVARVAFLPSTTPAQFEAIIGGQNRVIDELPLVFAGPTTDDMVGPEWRYDAVHFNEMGLREHARRWVDVISLPTCHGFEGVPDDECEPPPQPDAGLVEEDGGVAEPDLGLVDEDAGFVEFDSGADIAIMDAQPQADVEPMSRAPEMGQMERDGAAPSAMMPADMEGGSAQGGCDSVSAGTSPLFPAFLVLTCLVLRRSRREVLHGQRRSSKTG